MVKPFFINSERLTIRDFKKGDEKDIFDILKEPEVQNFVFYSQKEYSLADASQDLRIYLEEQQKKKRDHYFLAVELDGKVIGVVVLGQIDPVMKKCYLHYHFHKQFWGKGYATEAIREAIKWSFTELPIRTIEAETNTENINSRNLLLRLGFKKTFSVAQKPLKEGVFADVEIYVLQKEFT